MKASSCARITLELFLILWAVWLCVPDLALAGYLDSGSGSVLVQGIISVLAVFGRIRARIMGLVGLGRPGDKDM